jgi:hypothetical protein
VLFRSNMAREEKGEWYNSMSSFLAVSVVINTIK